MINYIIRRVLLGIPIVLGVLLILFVLFYLFANPDAMATRALGDKARPEQVEEWKYENNLHLPRFFNPNPTPALVITGATPAVFNGDYYSRVDTNGVEFLEKVRAHKKGPEKIVLDDGTWSLLDKKGNPVWSAAELGAATWSGDVGTGTNAVAHTLNFVDGPSPGIKKFTSTMFFDYFRRMLTWDFGESMQKKIKVTTMIKNGAGPSLALTIPIFFIGLIVSVTVSLLVALFRGTYIDKAALVIAVLGLSIVYFLYIIGGMYLVKLLRWFPISGWSSSHIVHFLTLPWLVGLVAGLARSVRFYRTVMVSEVNRDYIRTAKSKGASSRSILFKHLLKNAMIPILTQVVMAIPFLFMGSLLLEDFFGIPGLGRMTVDGINNTDFPVVAAMVYLGSLLFILGNILVDISYTFVDPRIRLN